MFLQGEDSVVECVHDGTNGNSVNAYMSWNAGKDNKRLKVRKLQIYLKLFRTHVNGSPTLSMVTIRYSGIQLIEAASYVGQILENIDK
jgi:hypothetical protein